MPIRRSAEQSQSDFLYDLRGAIRHHHGVKAARQFIQFLSAHPYISAIPLYLNSNFPLKDRNWSDVTLDKTASIIRKWKP